MEGELVRKTFTLHDTSLDCWVIKIGNKFWFKVHDIAIFLGYKNPNDTVCHLVPSKTQKCWDELRPSGFPMALIPPNWQPHTVLISEGGLSRLICRSKKRAAVKFENWVFDDVLPTLCETGTYTTNQQLQFLTEQLEMKEQLNVKLEEKVLNLCDKVTVMTLKDETKHVFQLYQNRTNPNKYIFIRPQSKYLHIAMKAINLEEHELLLEEDYVPNSMNILNRLKEKLKEQKIKFKASNNKLEVDDANILDMVLDLLEEPQA